MREKMIAMLRGKVEQVNGQVAVIDVAGVGYEVICSRACLEKLEPSTEAKLIVHTDVKQDSIRLYGFSDELERRVFLLLIEVQGVGCKSAADIVSRIDVRELLRAIGEGDVKRLQTVKGVGNKTSQRIIVELKDRVAGLATERQAASVPATHAAPQAGEDAIQALQALGFLRRDAERAVQAATEKGALDGATSGQIVKEALRFV